MTAEAGPRGAASYVPHAADALLLADVWAAGEHATRGRALVRTGTPFADDPRGWPAWLIVELMAQLVAAGAGLREVRPAVQPRLGLLLGVRAFTCDRDYFAPGTALEIEALESTRDEYGMGVFDCSVAAAGRRAASAMLSVYLPADVEAYLGSLEP